MSQDLAFTDVKRSEALLILESSDGCLEESIQTIDEIQAQVESDSADPPASDQVEADYPQSLITEHEQLFSWLGILAKHASFTAQTAATLWQKPIDEAEALLQHWAEKQVLMTRQGSRANPSSHTYQLPASLHQVAYQSLIQNGQFSPQQAHAIAIDRYRAQTYKQLWHTLEDDGYIHAHLTWHLQAANLRDEIHILLQEEAESGTNGWYEACDRQGYTAFFCRDLALAWQLAEDLYEQAPTQAIQLQCRYAMMTVAHHRIVTGIPANLVAAFVNQQVWTPTQGITYLELIQDPQHQFDVLQDLIPALPSTYHAYLLQVIKHQPHGTHQAQLLCILAPLLDPTLYPDLLKIVQAIDTDFYKAIVLRELAATLPTQYLDQTIAIVQTLAPTDAMVAACGIATRWPQTLAIYVQMLTQAAKDNLDEEDVYVDLLRAIIPAVSDSQLPQILVLINALQDAAARADLLIQLFPQHPQLLSVAFQTACTITDETACAIALGKLAPDLTDIDVQLALNILEKFKNPSAVRFALQPLSACHPSPSIGAKLIEMIDALPSESAQSQALCEIFPHLLPSAQADIKTRIDAVQDQKHGRSPLAIWPLPINRCFPQPYMQPLNAMILTLSLRRTGFWRSAGPS